MSMDKGLKTQGSLTRHRNVLTRAERVERLKEEERWDEDQQIFGLPKVEHRKAVTKKDKADADAEATAEADAEAEVEGEAASPEGKE